MNFYLARARYSPFYPLIRKQIGPEVIRYTRCIIRKHVTSVQGPSPRHCPRAIQVLPKKCQSGGEPLATLFPICTAQDLNLHLPHQRRTRYRSTNWLGYITHYVPKIAKHLFVFYLFLTWYSGRQNDVNILSILAFLRKVLNPSLSYRFLTEDKPVCVVEIFCQLLRVIFTFHFARISRFLS